MKNPQAFPGQDGMNEHARMNTGMRLLDYFAGKALQGMCSIQYEHENTSYEVVASQAYKQALAMLKEREDHIK